MKPYDELRFMYLASAGFPELRGFVEDPDVYGEEAWLTYFEGVTTSTGILSTAWGQYISGFAAVHDSTGMTIAVVGADFASESINVTVQRYALLSLFISIAFAVMVGLVTRVVRGKTV